MQYIQIVVYLIQIKKKDVDIYVGGGLFLDQEHGHKWFMSHFGQIGPL